LDLQFISLLSDYRLQYPNLSHLILTVKLHA
jgi:hypothetical protein